MSAIATRLLDAKVNKLLTLLHCHDFFESFSKKKNDFFKSWHLIKIEDVFLLSHQNALNCVKSKCFFNFFMKNDFCLFANLS